MERQIIIILAVLLSVSAQNDDIHQSPSDLISHAGEYHDLYCNHSGSTFRVILWYQQSTGDTSLKLIGYVNYKTPNVESSFEGQFNVSGDGAKHSTLHLLKLRAAEDSAVYYCAAKEAQCPKCPPSYTKSFHLQHC
ncbi:hypothetical protein AOLI_G00120040 [Acnodon oligacanthus]